MRHILMGCGSQYIHINLAVHALAASCHAKGVPVTLLETTVNRDTSAVLSELLVCRPDTAAFSCYLWNIEFILRLASDLKTACPGVTIILGGPEVSFRAPSLIKQHDYIDYILCGEGEESYPALLRALETGAPLPAGAVTRANGQIPERYPVVKALDDLPSVYTDAMLAEAENRIVYYESSRGCPFGCAYCLSSVCGGVRAFSMRRVERDLRKLAEAGVPLVKFVDRTFNWDIRRTLAILDILRALPGRTKWHFEVGGDLLNEQVIETMLSFPAGTLQLEMGVQSTHAPTLEAVGRQEKIEKLLSNARKIIESGIIHVHMDLIAGLPFEGMAEFEQSFNDVYRLHPHALQLGFLKLLHGTPLRRDAEQYGIRYRRYPPYEVLATPWMGAEELLCLKTVEAAVDRLYISGRFVRSLRYLETFFESPFALYQTLGRAIQAVGSVRPVSARALYKIVYDSGGRTEGVDTAYLLDLLRMDQYAAGVSGPLPGLLPEDAAAKQARVRRLLDEESVLLSFMPSLAGLSVRERNARLRFLLVQHDLSEGHPLENPQLVVFDRMCQDPVSGLLKPVLLSERLP